MKKGRAVKNFNPSFYPRFQKLNQKNILNYPPKVCPNLLMKNLLSEQAELKQLLKKILSELEEIKEKLSVCCSRECLLHINVSQETVGKDFVENYLVPLISSVNTSRKIFEDKSPAPKENNIEEDHF